MSQHWSQWIVFLRFAPFESASSGNSSDVLLVKLRQSLLHLPLVLWPPSPGAFEPLVDAAALQPPSCRAAYGAAEGASHCPIVCWGLLKLSVLEIWFLAAEDTSWPCCDVDPGLLWAERLLSPEAGSFPLLSVLPARLASRGSRGFSWSAGTAAASTGAEEPLLLESAAWALCGCWCARLPWGLVRSRGLGCSPLLLLEEAAGRGFLVPGSVGGWVVGLSFKILTASFL